MPPWAKGLVVTLLAGLGVGAAAAVVYLARPHSPPVSPVISTSNVAVAQPSVLVPPEADMASPALAGIQVTVEASDEAELQLEAYFKLIDCSEVRTGAATAHVTTENRLTRVFEFCTNAPVRLAGFAEDESQVVLSAYEDLAANAASGMEAGYSPIRHRLLRAHGQAGGQPVTLVVAAVSSELCSDPDCSEAAGTLSIGASLAESGGISLPVLAPSGAAAAASVL